MARTGGAKRRLTSVARELQQAIGEIVSVDKEGRACVRFGDLPPIVARSALDAAGRIGESDGDLVGAKVLLVFENGDPALPIIVGLVRDRLRPPAAPVEVKLDVGAARDVLIDGRRLVFDAHDEVVLRCGKSTIVLERDGRVLVRGTHVVSRSSGMNKIKGSSISLN